MKSLLEQNKNRSWYLRLIVGGLYCQSVFASNAVLCSSRMEQFLIQAFETGVRAARRIGLPYIDAEEVGSDVVVSAIPTFEKLRPDAGTSGILSDIASKRLVDRSRRRSSGPGRVNTNDESYIIEEMLPTATSRRLEGPERNAVDSLITFVREETAGLSDQLKQSTDAPVLNPPIRREIFQFWLEGNSNKAIAAAFELSELQVSNHVRHAKTNLETAAKKRGLVADEGKIDWKALGEISEFRNPLHDSPEYVDYATKLEDTLYHFLNHVLPPSDVPHAEAVQANAIRLLESLHKSAPENGKDLNALDRALHLHLKSRGFEHIPEKQVFAHVLRRILRARKSHRQLHRIASIQEALGEHETIDTLAERIGRSPKLVKQWANTKIGDSPF